MALDPVSRIDVDELADVRLDGDMWSIDRSVDERIGLRAHVSLRAGATRLVCVLPFEPTGSDAEAPHSDPALWAEGLDDAHVAVLGGMGGTLECPAWWLLNAQVDVIEHMAHLVRGMANRLGVEETDIVIYGSSIGGFAALVLAAEMDGACAVTDAPILDLRGPSVRNALARSVGDPAVDAAIDRLAADHPDRVSVAGRMRRARRIPPFLLLSDTTGADFPAHVALVAGLSDLQQGCLHVGTVRLEVGARAPGNEPSPAKQIARVVSGLYATGWTTEDRVERLTYREVVDRATRSVREVRFVRDADDQQRFARACADLNLVAEVNPSSDWPYLRLCALLKSWTNTFSADMLAAARQAFDRTQSLEAFIYCCRGIFANMDIDHARTEIELLIARTADPEIASVGEIFQGMIAYEAGDFEEYERRIDAFREGKTDEFNPYIAIPVSTVFTGTVGELPYRSRGQAEFLGAEIEVPPALAVGQFIAVASCDLAYFELYAKYLVQSFSVTNGDDGVLLIAVIGAEQKALDDQLRDWGASGVIAVAVDAACGENLGPSASLLRFALVAPLLERFDCPVIVLDLDAVVLRSFRQLLEAIGDVDVASRVLGYGVAPWEKYTGGFAIFSPTTLGRTVADYVARVGAKLLRPGPKQWWIDQNCFEAGIRLTSQDGTGLVVHNVMSLRDRFCVMPVGPVAAKEQALRAAFRQVVADRS